MCPAVSRLPSSVLKVVRTAYLVRGKVRYLCRPVDPVPVDERSKAAPQARMPPRPLPGLSTYLSQPATLPNSWGCPTLRPALLEAVSPGSRHIGQAFTPSHPPILFLGSRALLTVLNPASALSSHAAQD